jgi:hypothetical protein
MLGAVKGCHQGHLYWLTAKKGTKDPEGAFTSVLHLVTTLAPSVGGERHVYIYILYFLYFAHFL